MTAEGFDFSTIHPLHENLCLDFVNTASNREDGSEDYLSSYADLVSWGQDVDLLDADEANHLYEFASQQPARAAAIHQQAIALREALYRILLSVSRDETPDAADMDTLNTALTEAMSHMRLTPSDSGFGWMWEGDKRDPAHLIWQVVWSAGELLRSDTLKKVRQCGGCDWLFIDTSRGHRRRWCDMNTCGNREKARRHYRRTRTDDPS